MDEWHEVSGLPFAEAIRAGIWTIMAGHIALPALDKSRNICGSPCPGTLSHAILTDLLRGTLGFEGLVVSDDMNMGGVVGYATRRDRVIGAIRAGCDMYLFPKLPDDYDTLRDALRAGELSEARVTEACRRVLELKARLGLDQTTEPPVILEDREPVQMEAARRIAEGALVCVKDCRNLIPLRQLKPGARVLTMTFAQENFPFCDLPEIDKELTRRGFQVEHRMNPCECKIFETFSDFEAVFVNFNFRATWAYGSARSVGVHNRTFLGGFQFEHPAAVFTSFGSPYLLLDYPNLPNLINVHANDPASQKAAVAAWFGDLPFSGVSPVANLERTFK
jgi:beta-N-acetylhexosaminidase